jgi:tripartite-type tricarboxylate transporter receptor subunit TctC
MNSFRSTPFGLKLLKALVALAAAALALQPALTQAQGSFPSKPIRIIVPFSAGSGADAISRIYAQQLSEQMHVPVVIENKDGAGGMIGAAYVAKQPADGYTLLAATTPLVVGPISQGNASYDPIKDFAAVAGVANNPLAFVVGPTVPAKNMKELVAYARSNPGVLTYASSGLGTPSQLEMEALKAQLGIDIREIPYKSNAQALTDLLAGTVSIYYTVQSTSLSNLKAGKLRALAVGALHRTQALAEIPTVIEAASLPGYEALVWYGFVAPAGTPADTIARLHGEIARASQAPLVIDGIRRNGFEPALSNPSQLAADMSKEAQKATKAKASQTGAK